MIHVKIGFYDKKTDFIADEALLDLPKEMVFAAAESTNINEINSFVYDVSKEMKNYVIKRYPEYKEKFDLYYSSFIGRHGLGEGY